MYKHTGIPAALCLFLSLPLLLGACGGNGSDAGGPGDSVVPNALVEGAWSGSNSLGNSFDMLLLEDGSLHQVFGTAQAAGFVAMGVNHGTYSVGGNTLAANITQYNPNGGHISGTLAARVAASTIAGSAAASGAGDTPVTFSAQPAAQRHACYRYDTPAQLAEIAGDWPQAFVLGQASSFALTIQAADGALRSTSPGCTLTGQLRPRASQKNVFDVSLTVGGAPCLTPGAQYRGAALSYIAGNGQRQLSAALYSADNMHGTALYAQR